MMLKSRRAAPSGSRRFCSQFSTFTMAWKQGLNSFKVSMPCYLYSSPRFTAYASTDSLPRRLQGWILRPWLAATQAGITPAGLRDLARPQLWADPLLALAKVSAASSSAASSTGLFVIGPRAGDGQLMGVAHGVAVARVVTAWTPDVSSSTLQQIFSSIRRRMH